MKDSRLSDPEEDPKNFIVSGDDLPIYVFLDDKGEVIERGKVTKELIEKVRSMPHPHEPDNLDYLDHDLEPPEIAPGVKAGTGLIDEPKEAIDEICAGAYGDNFRLIPRSEWKDASELMAPRLREMVYRIHNQGGEGSCVSHGTTGCLEFKEAQTVQRKNGRHYLLSLSIVGSVVHLVAVRCVLTE